MEISVISGTTLKIRGKNVQVLIDPSAAMPKTACDAVLLLRLPQAHVSKVQDYRLIVEGAGEYEIKGVKISAFDLKSHVAYDIRIDNLELLVTTSEALQNNGEKMKEYHIIVVSTNSSLNQEILTALAPRVVVLYGQKAEEEAKSLGKETVQTAQKYQRTLEKLPEEMEVVVLK